MINVDEVVAKMGAACNISTSIYAKRTRDLIKLITDLRALGFVLKSSLYYRADKCPCSAQADFPLPRIAVIGNQSAGKVRGYLRVVCIIRLTVQIELSRRGHQRGTSRHSLRAHQVS